MKMYKNLKVTKHSFGHLDMVSSKNCEKARKSCYMDMHFQNKTVIVLLGFKQFVSSNK